MCLYERVANDDDDEKKNNLPHRSQRILLYLQNREAVPHTAVRLRADFNHGYIGLRIENDR